MTTKFGDTVFVRSKAFPETRPATVVSPGGKTVDVYVHGTGHYHVTENVKEIEFWDDAEGFFQPNVPYQLRPKAEPNQIEKGNPEGSSQPIEGGGGVGAFAQESNSSEPEDDEDDEENEESAAGPFDVEPDEDE